MQGLGGMRPGLNANASMSGNKDGGSSSLPIADLTDTVAGSRSYIVPKNGVMYVALTGGGGGGDNGNGGGGNGGGAGGGATYKKLAVKAGDVVSYTIAADVGSRANGNTSTATLPDGAQLTATGGQGAINQTPGAAGGVGSGGDLNRTGGGGAGSGPGSVSISSPDPGGGDIATNAGNQGNGGPAAGFYDVTSLLKGANSGTSVSGAGGNGTSGTPTGSGGRIQILIVRS